MATKPTYDDVRTTGQPQFLHNWVLNIIRFPNLGTFPDPESLNWRCTTSDIPVPTVPDATAVVRGQTVHYSSNIEQFPKTMTLAFVEDSDGTVKDFIYTLKRNQAGDGTGKGNKKVDTEFEFELILLADDSETQTYRFRVIGAQYSTTNLQGLTSGADAQIQQPTLTINLDRVVPEKA